jgi:hypothetical protein
MKVRPQPAPYDIESSQNLWNRTCRKFDGPEFSHTSVCQLTRCSACLANHLSYQATLIFPHKDSINHPHL